MEIIYRAVDGKEFNNKHGCESHEAKLKNPMAKLAVDDHEKLVAADVKGVMVGLFVACTIVEFEDGSTIEISSIPIKPPCWPSSPARIA